MNLLWLLNSACEHQCSGMPPTNPFEFLVRMNPMFQFWSQWNMIKNHCQGPMSPMNMMSCHNPMMGGGMSKMGGMPCSPCGSTCGGMPCHDDMCKMVDQWIESCPCPITKNMTRMYVDLYKNSLHKICEMKGMGGGMCAPCCSPCGGMPCHPMMSGGMNHCSSPCGMGGMSDMHHPHDIYKMMMQYYGSCAQKLACISGAMLEKCKSHCSDSSNSWNMNHCHSGMMNGGMGMGPCHSGAGYICPSEHLKCLENFATDWSEHFSRFNARMIELNEKVMANMKLVTENIKLLKEQMSEYKKNQCTDDKKGASCTTDEKKSSDKNQK